MRVQIVRVCGEVQHTGFRRLIWRHAKRLGLRGYARNLPGGCVEIVVAATRGEAEKLVESIMKARMISIENVEISESVVREDFEDFEVR